MGKTHPDGPVLPQARGRFARAGSCLGADGKGQRLSSALFAAGWILPVLRRSLSRAGSAVEGAAHLWKAAPACRRDRAAPRPATSPSLQHLAAGAQRLRLARLLSCRPVSLPVTAAMIHRGLCIYLGCPLLLAHLLPLQGSMPRRGRSATGSLYRGDGAMGDLSIPRKWVILG